ncbi:fungal-specific transcription factor domain-containing protein [Aspergillus germanicus]
MGAQLPKQQPFGINALTNDAALHVAPFEQSASKGISTNLDPVALAPLQATPDLLCPSLNHDGNTPTTSSFEHSAVDLGVGADVPNIQVDDSFPPGDILGSRLWPTLWNCQWDEDWSLLLAGGEFDLDAVNQTLLESTDGWPHNISADRIDSSIDPDPPADSRTGPSVLQRKWHTFSETTNLSGNCTPELPRSTDASSQLRVHGDVGYREKLVDSLRQRVQPGILPSTSFLDLCLQAYFTHFHPIFPLIHAPTFQPSKHNAVLLLSICSVGSLFLGSSRALAHGISMYERLNKAILASWDIYIQATGSNSIQALQASLIGQTFGLLTGRPKDLLGTEVFHGSVVAWARKARVFALEEEDPIGIEALESHVQALSDAWKTWVRVEEKKRIILGIHVHDAELAKLHNHEPLLRHSPERLPQLCAPDIFAAPNPTAWKALYMKSLGMGRARSPSSENSLPQLPRPLLENDFVSYASLEVIGAIVSETTASGSSKYTTVSKCQDLLIGWYNKYIKRTNRNPVPDHFCLMILWHSIFMHLYTPFNELECACGRDGEVASQRHRRVATSWAGSSDAVRTLLHACLIQHHFQLLPVGAEPAMHVPMALYRCGIAWTSFTRFGSSPGEESVHTTEDWDFPELRLFDTNEVRMFQDIVRGVQRERADSAPLFRIIDLLGKISHWKVAGSFATTLLSLVEDVQDLF